MSLVISPRRSAVDGQKVPKVCEVCVRREDLVEPDDGVVRCNVKRRGNEGVMEMSADFVVRRTKKVGVGQS